MKRRLLILTAALPIALAQKPPVFVPVKPIIGQSTANLRVGNGRFFSYAVTN